MAPSTNVTQTNVNTSTSSQYPPPEECPHPHWTGLQRLSVLGLVLLFMGIAGWQHMKLVNEYRLREALMQIAQDTSTAFVISDEYGTVTTWSSGAERMFGLSADQAIGGSVETLIPPEMRPAHRSSLSLASERGGLKRGMTVLTCEALKSDGTRFGAVITIRSVAGHQLRYLTQINYADDVNATDLTSVRH